MKDPIYIYHHMGLGDHLVCNAIVRYYAGLVDPAILFVKPEYLDTVKFMYRDLDNLKFISVPEYRVDDVISKLEPEQLIKIGFSQMNTLTGHFDERFYKLANLPFENRWDFSRVDRDRGKELELFKKLNLTPGKYVFVHDDHDRSFKVNELFILDKTLPIIRPTQIKTDNIFEWSTVIEEAAEIHCMDSCFLHLVEILNPVTDLLYFHAYVRGYAIEGMASYRKKWIKI